MPPTRSSTPSRSSYRSSSPSRYSSGSHNTSSSVPAPVSTPPISTGPKSSVMTDIASTAAGVVAGNVMTHMILGGSKKETSSTVINHYESSDNNKNNNQNQLNCAELFKKYECCISSEFNQDCKSLLDEFKKCYTS